VRGHRQRLDYTMKTAGFHKNQQKTVEIGFVGSAKTDLLDFNFVKIDFF
jgi:hypothetical protein